MKIQQKIHKHLLSTKNNIHGKKIIPDFLWTTSLDSKLTFVCWASFAFIKSLIWDFCVYLKSVHEKWIKCAYIRMHVLLQHWSHVCGWTGAFIRKPLAMSHFNWGPWTCPRAHTHTHAGTHTHQMQFTDTVIEVKHASREATWAEKYQNTLS